MRLSGRLKGLEPGILKSVRQHRPQGGFYAMSKSTLRGIYLDHKFWRADRTPKQSQAG
ncbi:MAG: hypothetical protein M1609_09650 [Firmicutes bacterium]|nr:hypothetical protein [Bacillota bacterium]